MTGRVESAVRGSVSPGELLVTPTGRGGFKIARYTSEGLVLLLGVKEAWTPLPGKPSREFLTSCAAGVGSPSAACTRRTVSQGVSTST